MAIDSWIDDEPGARAALQQAGRVLRRGVRRPLATLLAGALVALAAVGIVVLLEPPYRPGYVLRVVETDRDPGTMPRPRRELRQYVLDAVFTTNALLAIIQKHGLYPALMRHSRRAALESFRDDIELDVYRNYFVEARSAHEAPRSARIAVRYRSEDPAIALAVTRDLGKLIVERERAERAKEAAQAARSAKRALDRLEHEATKRRREIAEKQIEISDQTTARPDAEIELVGLMGTLASLDREITAAQRTNAELELGAAYESSNAGMRFEVVDDGSIAKSDRLQPVQLAGIGIVTLALGLPLAALAVGAFAPSGGRA